jgi:hypothetical protein
MKKKIALLAVLATVGMNATAQFWDVTTPQRLGGTVNSPAEEGMPVFSKDSSILYFTRTYDANNTGGEFDQDIWFSKRDASGNYTNCEKVKGLNNNFNNAVLGLSRDGNTAYLLNAYSGKKDTEKGIATSVQKGSGWESPKKLEIPGLDIEGDFYGFHVNDAENVIIISYKGPNSVGAEDLYVSTKSGSTWSAPVHMGNVINSTGFEISPFLNSRQDTLFFSSNGHGGQGDADIFYSVKQGSWTSWSKPVNLGSKINSPKFDAFFTVSGNQLYWASNRESERADIYLAYIKTPPPVSIACKGMNVTVFGGSDGKVDATVTGGVSPFTYSWSNGVKTEDINGLKKGDYTVTVTDAIGQTATCSSTLTEPGPPQDITFKHYFEYNADKLSISEGKLQSFVSQIEQQMKSGREKISIAIYSSASNVPTRTFGSNDKLARSRAQQMEKELNTYFAAKGLSDKVKVKVASSAVNGPKYEGDFDNQEKYREYQFIELKTE